MKTTVDLGGLEYIIHDDGSIEKRRGKGFRKSFPDKDGYLKVAIPTKQGTYNEPLHRVMWRAFKGPIPGGMTVDHIDNDKSHNHLDNFQLLTPEQNSAKGNARNWIAIDPAGTEHPTSDLVGFCKENNLHVGHMREVAHGYRNQTHSKGWKCYESL